MSVQERLHKDHENHSESCQEWKNCKTFQQHNYTAAYGSIHIIIIHGKQIISMMNLIFGAASNISHLIESHFSHEKIGLM